MNRVMEATLWLNLLNDFNGPNRLMWHVSRSDLFPLILTSIALSGLGFCNQVIDIQGMDSRLCFSSSGSHFPALPSDTTNEGKSITPPTRFSQESFVIAATSARRADKIDKMLVRLREDKVSERNNRRKALNLCLSRDFAITRMSLQSELVLSRTIWSFRRWRQLCRRKTNRKYSVHVRRRTLI